MSARSRRRALLLAVAALAAVEAGLRVAHALEHGWLFPRPPGVELLTVPAADAALLYTYRAGTDRTNSHGYRDREYALAKARDVFRIVVIGDSVAEGFRVSLEDSFPKRVEQLLNGRRGMNVEVPVLARTGYSTSQEIVLLREEAFRYAPDLVLWSYVLNDPADPVYHNANGELGSYYARPKVHLFHALGKLWFRLREQLGALGGPREWHERLHYVYWKDVERNLATVGALGREHHVPIVFFVTPLFEGFTSFDRYPWRALHERLNSAARASGLRTVDLLPAFSSLDPARLHTPGDPWHPNAEGHRREAEALAQELEALDLLPGPGHVRTPSSP